MQGDLDFNQSETVALRVREELARRRLSRQWLADSARLSISTLEKALSGRRPFTLGTVIRLEEALGIELRMLAPQAAAAPIQMVGVAPQSMGAYARAAVRWLEADYLTLRPSFDEPGAIYAYRTMIEWDDEHSHLRFIEAARLDAAFTQTGFVSLPHLSGHIYLVTQSEGQYRMVILGRPSAAAGGALCGILSSLVSGAGSQLIPAATAITLIPTAGPDEPQLGVVRPGDACYDAYRRRVDQIGERGFARFPG
ncbi:MAG TPA: helix-turn-helix transcriptional regulator [Allosphingosinicella sp.]